MPIERNCIEYDWKFHKSQVHGDKINAPPIPLFQYGITMSIFYVDVIGLVNLKENNGHYFILVAIDYFTKWMETCFYVHVTQK
jgi:hypothetical protein